MSKVEGGKVRVGNSVTPANNFEIDTSADDGTMILKREDGSVVLSVSATGVVDIGGSGDPYGTDNVLGVVSQSGGIPTGAIIETGSNANGTYTKFANGMMIAEKLQLEVLNTTLVSGTFTYAAGTFWTFPAAFTGNPPAGICQPIPSSGVVFSYAFGTSLASFQPIAIGSSASDSVGGFHMAAIGRWF